MKKWLLILCVLPLLSSCGTQQELNDLSIVIGIGMDEADPGYQVTLQLVDPSEISTSAGKSSGGKAVPVINMVGKGASLNEAFQEAVSKISRRTFYSHLSVVVIGEPLARRGITEIIEHLERGSEIRSSLLLLTAKDQTALEVLSALPPLTKVPALSALGKLENNMENYGSVIRVNIIDWVKMNQHRGMYAVMPGIYNNGDPNVFTKQANLEQSEPYSTAVGYTAVFSKQGKLMYWLGPNETKAMLILQNKIRRTFVNAPCDSEHISYELPFSKSSSQVAVENGRAVIKVNVRTRSELYSLGCMKNKKLTEEIIRRLEHEMTAKLRSEIMQSISIAQDHKTDLFGFGQILATEDAQQWKRIKHQWDQLFEEAEIHVKVSTELLRGGVIESHM
ncbi:Ger(x)C family spore germination protein [Bacillus sp. FJAT-42376]|uniref:Ger(x)C family spore germination protein n=1 Tax=Bacillus sp. FJAT-42376 TaxID=2014076 RepID=UPI000F4EB3E0|nr:Ger(x)C family spore germination protein [Bacillus sp. FJAT-42376]AZB41985.1 Ger(x)C family spore germination protein [Bacillus sp. FJAT-42376]